LFSAVVTAFVVQSYQLLQESSTDVAVAILSQIASQDGVTDRAAPTVPPFSPTSSAIRVNILWFLSLILSLTTVLSGIVSLQWLREYLRYPTHCSPKQKFAIRNMRAEAFDRWYVPHILAGLPVLLQIALVLFFAGLVDFLLQLHLIVAIPVIILVSSTLLFLLLTTILPSLQALYIINSLRQDTAPNQSPFKSPQAWAFLRMTSSQTFRILLGYIRDVILTPIIILTSTIVIVLESTCSNHYGWIWFDNHASSLVEVQHLQHLSDWTELDCLWLDERQRLSNGVAEKSSHFRKVVGDCDFDCARGIAVAVNQYSRDEKIAFAAHRCFQKLPVQVVFDDIYTLMSNRLPLWGTGPAPSRIFPATADAPPSVAKDENEMFLLAHLPQTYQSSPIHTFRKLYIELFIRTTRSIFAGGPGMNQIYSNEESASPHPIYPRRFLVPQSLQSVQELEKLPKEISLGKSCIIGIINDTLT